MSYEIIKSIVITEDKVFITSASNNVIPRTYYRTEWPYFTKILKEKGKEETEIEILKAYEEGNFQDGKNKYTKALEVLYYVFGEEYKKYDWRLSLNDGRQDEDYFKLLKKALNYKLPKNKYIIYKFVGTIRAYGKRTKYSMKWSDDIKKATKFNFKDEAENQFKHFNSSQNWQIEEIN